MYFIQEFGESSLKLNFKKAKYGPYCENINHILQGIDGHYITGYGDRNGISSIQLVAENIDKVEYFLDNHPHSLKILNKISKLIEGYETPYGLELLATVHWTHSHEKITDFDEIVDFIHKWNSRKQELFTRNHIIKALATLDKNHLLKSYSIATT